MLLMRWDMLLWSNFELWLLNGELFYVANWCAQICNPTNQSQRGNEPAGSLVHPFWPPGVCTDETGVPDFYYAANFTLMTQVFVGLVDGWHRGTFSPDTCCCGHGIMNGRLSMPAFSKNVAGYLWHDIDYTFVRGQGLQRARCMGEEVGGGGMMWTEWQGRARAAAASAANVVAYDVRLPQRHSICPNTLNSCDPNAKCLRHM
jgi:hypothetical protein